MRKKGISICWCILLFISCFSATFASDVVFNSSISSGETLEIGGETYTLIINQQNNDILIKGDKENNAFLSYFEEVVLDNYIFIHDGSTKSGSAVLNETTWGNTNQNLITRIRLIVKTYEPKIEYNWSISTHDALIGETIEFILSVNNSEQATAENLKFTHELPKGFIVTKVKHCDDRNGIIEFETIIEEGDTYTCEYKGYFLDALETETLSSQIVFQTTFQNRTHYPDVLELTVQEPFKISYEYESVLNWTARFNVSIEIENNFSEKIVFSDIFMYFPRDYVSVESISMRDDRVGSIPFETILDYDVYKINKETLSSSGDAFWLNSSLRADSYGFIPFVLGFDYTFDDQLYSYGPKKHYLNISPNPPFENRIEVTYTLSNISDTNLDTYSTGSENMHLKMKNLCDCTFENITVQGSFLGETIFDSSRDLLLSRSSYYVNALDIRIPFYLAKQELPFAGTITYYDNKSRVVEDLNGSVTVGVGSVPTFSKTVSESEVYVSEPLTVEVLVKNGLFAPNMSFTFWEDEEALEEHFLFLGPTKRTLKTIADGEIQVYQYELIPKQVTSKTTFSLKTNYTYNYFDLLVYNEVLENASFDAKNKSHKDQFWYDNVNDSLYFYAGSFTEDITVLPAITGLVVTGTYPESVVEGDLFTVEYALTNNGTTELRDIVIEPRGTSYFQSISNERFSLTQLFPDEERIFEFTYRLIHDNRTEFEKESFVSESYVTLENISISQNTSLATSMDVTALHTIIVPYIEATFNRTSKKTTQLVSFDGEGLFDMRVYYVNGTSVDEQLSQGDFLLYEENTDLLGGNVERIVHLVESKEFTIPQNFYVVGSSLETIAQQERQKSSETNDSQTTQTQIGLVAGTNVFSFLSPFRIFGILFLLWFIPFALSFTFVYVRIKKRKMVSRSSVKVAAPAQSVVNQNITRPVVKLSSELKGTSTPSVPELDKRNTGDADSLSSLKLRLQKQKQSIALLKGKVGVDLRAKK